MLSIFFVIFGIAIVIIVHELGHFLSAKLFGIGVEEFGLGFPPRLISKKIKNTRYSLNLLPLGGFVKIVGEDQTKALSVDVPGSPFFSAKFYKRFIIIGAGVMMNFLLGYFLITSLYLIGKDGNPIISQIIPGTPAEIGGLKQGDQFLDFKTPEQVIDFVNSNKGATVNFRILRDSSEIIMPISLNKEATPGKGILGSAISSFTFPKLPLHKALFEGLKTSISIIVQVIKGLGGILSRLIVSGKVDENIIGPIGIFSVAVGIGKTGLFSLVQLLVLISLNLAVINLLPLPALDGGRLLFLLIEKIKGSPFCATKEALANTIGFAILLFLMLIITIKDIIRLF